MMPDGSDRLPAGPIPGDEPLTDRAIVAIWVITLALAACALLDERWPLSQYVLHELFIWALAVPCSSLLLATARIPDS